MKNPFSNKNSKLLLFLLIFISILSIRSGKYTPIVSILFFIGLFFFYRPVLTNTFLRFFAVIIFLTFWGAIRGNDFNSIIEDLMSFSPLILLFISNQSIKSDLNARLPIYLANSLLFLLPLSLVIFKYMDYGIGNMNTVRFAYDESTNLAFFSPVVPLLFAAYLVFFFDKLNKRQKWLIHIAMIFIALMGIITLSKSVILGSFIPYLLYYGYKYLGSAFRPIKFLKLALLVFLIGITISQSGIIERSGLGIAIEGVILRSTIQIDDGDISSGRLGETESYLNQNLDFFEYLFGRGMGGHKVRNDYDPYIGGINMMHIGPVHAFLKGGILLVLILYIPAFLAIARFWKTPDYHISLILIFFLIGNFQTTTWSWSISLFFYWYGISFYYRSKQNVSLVIKG